MDNGLLLYVIRIANLMFIVSALVVCFSVATPTSIYWVLLLIFAFSFFSSLILFALPKKYPKTLDEKKLLPTGLMHGPLFRLACARLYWGFECWFPALVGCFSAATPTSIWGLQCLLFVSAIWVAIGYFLPFYFTRQNTF